MPGLPFNGADRKAFKRVLRNVPPHTSHRLPSNYGESKCLAFASACRNDLKQGNGAAGSTALGNTSAEVEHDLAALVHDFLENGSSETDFRKSSYIDNELSNTAIAIDTLQALKRSSSIVEEDLIDFLTLLMPSIKETGFICLEPGAECNGSCIRKWLVQNLRLSGYDAAVCKSRWQSSGKGPGGEYEYISVDCDACSATRSRLIVDIDFRSQFQIARPTQGYLATLKSLPLIFVGSDEKLEQVLQVMAEAAKLSLKQRSMPLPPWRTFDYMSAKWMSPYERKFSEIQSDVSIGLCSRQCVEQIRHLYVCLSSEMEKHIVKAPADERDRGIALSDYRRPLTWVAQQTV